MKKKGQITIFIIVAILIVGIGVSFFIFKDSIFGKNEVSSEIAPIKNFVDSCIESEIEETVYLIGEGGGYYFPPILSNSGGNVYYFYEGENYFPSRSKIESQFSNSLESRIFYCVKNFQNFPNYKIEKSNLVVETEILDDRIIFDVEFPLKIEKGGETFFLKDFGNYNYNVRLGLIHKGVYELIEENYYSEDSVCFDCFNEMVVLNGLDIEFIEGGLENSVFIIRDYMEEYNKTFEFVFAV
jgi:hypothetical protein